MKKNAEYTIRRSASFIIRAALCAGFVCVSTSRSVADVIFLNDGSVLTGKVTRSGEGGFEFRNSYGTFSIKDSQVKKKYVTASYREDVEICRKQNLKIQETDIRRNYEAGEKAPVSEPGLWDYGRISVFGIAVKTGGRLSSKLSSGRGVAAAFDLGPDFLSGQRYSLLPGLRIEAGYQWYGGGKPSAKGPVCDAGPLWRFRLPGNAGSLAAGAFPGASFLSLRGSDFSSKSTKFTIQSLAGWEYESGALSLFIHGRHVYIYDRKASMWGAGIAAGIGYRI